MRVSFKLSLVQLARARAQQLKVELRDSVPESADHYGGNLVGWVEDHGFSYNYNQHLNLDLDVVTYTGERHPFQQDGMMQLLGQLLTGDENPVSGWWLSYSPVVYDTSDTRLRWYETLQDYLYDRASLEEILRHVASGHRTAVRPEQTKAVKKNVDVLAAIRGVALMGQGRGTEAGLRASFHAQSLTAAKTIVAYTNKSWF